MAGKSEARQQDTYEIVLEGYLDAKWADWLGGLAISHDDDETTTLSGALPDQTALHSILSKIRDMNLALGSVRHISGTEEET